MIKKYFVRVVIVLASIQFATMNNVANATYKPSSAFEHHLEVILGLADRIAVLNYGELLVCDTPQNVINNPIVQSAYIGEAL